MKFNDTVIEGVYLIEPKKTIDDRGCFVKVWSERIFREKGLKACNIEINMSYTKKKGTFRGLHYQVGKYQEAKLLRCIKGSIYDVIIDVRKNSPTYKEWLSFELNSEDNKMIYIPEGCAHGFLTLTDNTQVEYQVSEVYNPESEMGIRYDDPTFEIDYPIGIRYLSEKDKSWTNYADEINAII